MLDEDDSEENGGTVVDKKLHGIHAAIPFMLRTLEAGDFGKHDRHEGEGEA